MSDSTEKNMKFTLPTNSFKDSIFVTDFDDKAAMRFHDEVMQQSKKDPDMPIIINISSYGGYVDALASMVETIQSVPNKIITVTHGHAMSCGAILMSFGDYRFIGKHSRIMIHEVSGGAIGDTHDMHTDATEVKRLNEYWLGEMAKNCGFKNYKDIRDYIKTLDGRNIWLNAKQSVEFGIADYVGLPEIMTENLHRVLIKPDKKNMERRKSPHSTVKTRKKTRTTKKKTTRRAKASSRKTETKTTQQDNTGGK